METFHFDHWLVLETENNAELTPANLYELKSKPQMQICEMKCSAAWFQALQYVLH